MKYIIFGAGENGQILKQYFENNNAIVVGIADNYMQGDGILTADEILEKQYDYIVISVAHPEAKASIFNQLRKKGIPDEKIICLLDNNKLKTEVFSTFNRYNELNDPRVCWLREFAQYVYAENIMGSVAECGVNRGEFSEYINKYFNDRKCYLFDTFEGFTEDDLSEERKLNNNIFNAGVFNSNSFFHCTSEDIVKRRLPYLDVCEIRKGWFPETAAGLTDNFVFVSLDMDLYKPMLSGLKYFYPHMSTGGVLLLHDYFQPELPGVKKAVIDFENMNKLRLCKLPIGDGCSIAVIKS